MPRKRLKYVSKHSKIPLARISLWWPMLTLLGVSVFMIFSSTLPTSLRIFGDEYRIAYRHVQSVLISIILAFVFSKINYQNWNKISPFLLASVLFLLFLVFIPGIGINVSGASRWIDLGFTSLQPSELAKLVIIIYFASLSGKKKDIAPYLIPMVVVTGLILLQPDLGTAVSVSSISFVLMYLAGVDIKKLLLISLVALLFTVVLILTSSYRRDRLMTYLGLEKDTLGKSYHINQVLYALGSGGLLGVGLGESKQKYLYLPETATDSIFPIYAEEFGFIGSLILIFLILYYIYRVVTISLTAPDNFSSIFASGLASWVAIQTIFNIGAMVVLLPLTGIPLPFISYGGTAVAALGIATGIAINIEKKSKH